MIILGIETSCDETAVSVLEKTRPGFKILAHTVASQIKTLKKYGGVVPEVAARQHILSMVPTLDTALHTAKIKPKQFDAIAVTAGPGLVTSLRIGVQAAKTLALAWNKNLVGVNHIEGHIYANFLDQDKIAFPAICLVVSGGHTEIILMKGHGQYHLIGRTRDDAAGEAFDKVAKILNVGYPGGPRIQALAQKGDPKRFNFPRPMLDRDNFEFSFSGLKTSVLYFIKKEYAKKKIPLPDICASFQQAVIDVLVTKTVRAALKHRAKSVLLAGGVAANQPLRAQLGAVVKKGLPRTFFHIPNLSLCTDNASMIAIAGYYHAVEKDFISWKELDANPNWELV